MRRLITIPISHFCEKARWALERAGLEYREERHVQGIHQVVARRAGGGSTVPVLVAPDAVLTESEAILHYADGELPEEGRLFPAEPGLRADVEALSRELDGGLGPDGRRVMYLHMLPHKTLLLRFNNAGVPTWEAAALRAVWPLAVRWARRELAMAPERLAEDERLVHDAFDRIALRLQDGRPHLCGARFTAADLTFACLAASVVLPPEYGVQLPEPDELPEPAARAVRQFRAHPAGAYALRLFRDHRPR
jgi:glutathione S-transferase